MARGGAARARWRACQALHLPNGATLLACRRGAGRRFHRGSLTASRDEGVPMKVMWQTRKLGSGAWEGTIDVPCGTAADVRVASKAKGPTQAHALARAATVAETALESPIL